MKNITQIPLRRLTGPEPGLDSTWAFVNYSSWPQALYPTQIPTTKNLTKFAGWRSLRLLRLLIDKTP